MENKIKNKNKEELTKTEIFVLGFVAGVFIVALIMLICIFVFTI